MFDQNNAPKIIIIEDNEDIREMYEKAFEIYGFHTMSSPEGLTGILDVISKKPDIVLLDLNMPQMDGFGFLEALKKNTSIRDLMVVVCSNLSNARTVERVLKAGADYYLKKTEYSARELVQKVMTLMETERELV